MQRTELNGTEWIHFSPLEESLFAGWFLNSMYANPRVPPELQEFLFDKIWIRKSKYGKDLSVSRFRVLEEYAVMCEIDVPQLALDDQSSWTGSIRVYRRRVVRTWRQAWETSVARSEGLITSFPLSDPDLASIYDVEGGTDRA